MKSLPHNIILKPILGLAAIFLGTGLLLSACGQSTPTQSGFTPTNLLAAGTSTLLNATANSTASPLPETTSDTGVVAATGQASPTIPVARATPKPTTTATRQLAPVVGGTLTVALNERFGSTDPVIGFNQLYYSFEHQLHLGLLNYDNGTTLIPELAETMPTISPDGKVFTFKLRNGLKFSNGQPLTARDFKYSWQRIFDPAMQSPFKVFFQVIEGAQAYQESLKAGDKKVTDISGLKVVDDLTLQVTLTRPDQTFLNVITMPAGSPVPEGEVEKYWIMGHTSNEFYKYAVGTGPFMLKDWSESWGITLVKNPYYWRSSEGIPYLDSLVYHYESGQTQAGQVSKVKSGEIDLLAEGIAPSGLSTLQADPLLNKQLKVNTAGATRFVFMNTKMKPFDNVKVRQAFALIFDRKKAAHSNNSPETGAIFPPILPGYSQENNVQYSKFDPQKARELLKTAGFDFNQPLTFVGQTLPEETAEATALIADMQAAGILVNARLEQFDAFLSDISRPNNVQIGLSNWEADFPDPSDFVTSLLSCGSAVEGGTNPSFYCNRRVDELELKARAIQNNPDRLEAYRQLEKMILDEQPLIPIDNPVRIDLIGNKVGGYFSHPVWFYDFARIYKTK